MIDRSLNYGRQHIETFLKLSSPFKVVIDLGAGHGDDLMSARKVMPDATLYAIEAYPSYIQELEKGGVSVYPLNIEKDRLPFADSSVDVIIANQILEHVKEIFWIFHEITRILRTGGNLIIGVPNLASLHNRMLLLFGKQPTQIQNDSAHVRGFTKSDLIKFLNIWGGYRLVQFRGSNFYPFPPIIAKPLASIFPNMAWGIFFLLEKNKEYNDEFIKWPRRKNLETNFFTGE